MRDPDQHIGHLFDLAFGRASARPERKTPVSAVNAAIEMKRPNVDLDIPCPKGYKTGGWMSQRVLNSLRHDQDVWNSIKKRDHRG